MSDMNIVTRLDSYFTNLTLPWERKGTQKKAEDKNNGSLWRQ